jgi:hypothetical protein
LGVQPAGSATASPVDWLAAAVRDGEDVDPFLVDPIDHVVGESPEDVAALPRRPILIQPALKHQQRPELLAVVAPAGLVLVNDGLHIAGVEEAFAA